MASFEFLELPLELRRLVLGELLTRPHPILVQESQGNFVTPVTRPGDGLLDFREFFPDGSPEEVSNQLRLRRGTDNPSLAILRASKEVHEEAEDVLWRKNTFVFPDPGIASTFFRENRVFPRVLQVAFWIDLREASVPRWMSFLNLLTQAEEPALSRGTRIQIIFSRPRKVQDMDVFNFLFANPRPWHGLLKSRPDLAIEIGFCHSMMEIPRLLGY
jgi:hypothetical protein